VFQSATICILQLWQGSKISLLIHKEGVAYLRLDEEIFPRVQHRWGEAFSPSALLNLEGTFRWLFLAGQDNEHVSKCRT